MIELWGSEAEKYNVPPLTTRPGRGGDRRYRRERYEYRPGIGSLPEAVAPNLRNRGWRMLAELDVGGGGADGVIAAHGSCGGGYAVYVRDSRLVFTYNHLGTTVNDVVAEV